jgi:16S rRNA (adenine1518-N6/adenine1519-N6)-dimethyltransferase
MRAYGLYPDKRLGQNFLVDPVALDRIVAAADLTPDDTILEIGAGLGTLTRRLAQEAGRVLAVELDRRFLEILHAELDSLPNLEIIHGDILKLPGFPFANMGYKLVSNLPYNITSAVLRRFLETEPRPSLMVVTVQREVANRVVAQPGGMSLLAVSVQLYGQPRIVAQIPAGAFYPRPKVDSAVLRIEVCEKPKIMFDEGFTERAFFRTVRAGFQSRRKMLRNSLSGGLALPRDRVEAALADAGVDPGLRAQRLSLQEWGRIARALWG